ESEAPPTQAASGLKGKKVLVVDDDVRNLFAVTSLLERHTMQVLPAGNANEAYEALAHHPDVAIVLMDMMMPEVDGYQATRRIREQHRRLPIVALTAKAMTGDREKALEAGCDDFVAKPVESERLVEVLEKWTRSREPAPEKEKLR